jgi:sugar phosphate isomerase/epimerase
LRAADGSSGPRFAVRSPLKGKTLRERAELCGRLGFEGIELGGGEWFAPPVEQILKDLDGTGVRTSAVSALQKLLDPDPQERQAAIGENKRRLEKARALGAVAMVVVPVFGQKRQLTGSPEDSADRPHATEDRLLIAALKELAPTAEQTGVKIVMEPLTKKETYYMNLQEHALAIARQVGSPAVGVLSDFYHMQMEERDIPAALTACGGRTYYVHAADGVKRTEPGSLPFDYRPGFAVLKRNGFTGWVTIEGSASTADIPGALARSLAYLKKQWNEA